MNRLSLADIHCDTAFELFKRSESFLDTSLSVSAKLAVAFDNYIQVTAIWSDKRLDNDTAYQRFFQIREYLKKDIEKNISAKLYDGKELSKKNNLILSVEDARILNGDISRLKSLYDAGIRILTLLWSGDSCIGGAFNTDNGLTDFGKTVVRECIELGIIPDISHASLKSSYEVFDICNEKIPVIASHSDSYEVHHHSRNLTDEQFIYIKKSNGLVGINLCCEHLGINDNEASIRTVMRHIEHYLELGGEDTVCFGCDFDGADTPAEFPNISSLFFIAEEMSKLNYSYELIDKIFYSNVKNFIFKYINQ